MEMYVGLDVHSKQSVFVIEDENGKVVARGKVATSRKGMERLRTAHALPRAPRWAWRRGRLASSWRANFREWASFHRGRCTRGAAQGPSTDPEE